MAVSKWFASKILPTSMLTEFFKYFPTSEQIAVIQVEGKKRELASVMSISRKNWQHVSCTEMEIDFTNSLLTPGQ